MLYQITAHFLVNVDDAEYPDHQPDVVTDGLNELFREAGVGPACFIADWAYDQDPADPSERHVIARPDLDLDDYEEGEFLIAS